GPDWPVTAFLAYFAGERPSIFAISSSRLSGGGSVFAFPDRTLRSAGGEESCSGSLTLPLTASLRGFRTGGDSARTGERAAADGGVGDSIGFVGRLNAASSRCAISARLFSSDCTPPRLPSPPPLPSIASPL